MAPPGSGSTDLVCCTLKMSKTGGEPVRKKFLPPRKVFGEDELEMVKRVFERSWETGVDFGFQGEFEKRFSLNAQKPS